MQQVFNGRYQLEEKIGEGGMARVYRGRDLRLNRRVAIKVLHSQYTSDPSFLGRFNHEAQSAANLRNAHIIDIYDVGQDGDVPYIVMEYVDGQDLKALLRLCGPLPPARAVAIAEQVADGLDAAHRAGLVHRDIKPQNIIIGQNDQVKVTDFGIAKSALSTSATETGVIFGTADYLSPEQARGLSATAASDIYSLGVTLYEMLTGRLPFTGDSSIAVAMQHVSTPPPLPSSYNPRIPPQLEQLVLAAMEKDPARRPASARAFAQILRSYQQMGTDGTVVRPALPRTSPAPVYEPNRGDQRPQPQPRPRPVSTGTTLPQRAPLPPRSSVPAEPQRGGIDFGGFLLGLLLIAGVLGLVTLFALGAFDGLFPSTGPGARPTVIAATTTIPTSEATAEPTAAPTALPLIFVPNVVGLDGTGASATLSAAGLTPVEDARRISDTVPAGRVIDQLPAGGSQITQTSTVTYALSLGSSLVNVPDVRNVRQQVAEQQIREAGLIAEITQEPSQAIDKGFVIRQSPGPGLKINKGETVALVVSLGDEVVMPDLAGLDEDAAKQKIADLGLVWSFTQLQDCTKLGTDVCNRYAAGQVVSSVPGVGQTVKRGAPVTLGVRDPNS